MTTSASPQDLETARLLLNRLGVDPAELLTASAPEDGPSRQRPMPTIREWIPVVAALLSPSTAASYGSYWAKAEAVWGDRPMDTITATEIKAQSEIARATAVVRRNSRGGRNAAENFIAAVRCLYKHLENDGRLDQHRNPARRVTKPRRNASTRRALPHAQLSELNDVVASTGDDPELDALLCRLHEETACRRGGALALRPRDLDRRQCTVLLREKGETERWQPVSPTLMRHLIAHGEERGNGDREEQLLRYANGNPITKRRYDYIFRRVQAELDWARALQVSAHWLRHTTLTWVERNFGIGVARAYAGHADTGSDLTTTSYVKADITEVAAALAALTGEPHPLAA
ncbi:tyrosine-type recombinase/integrase [Amycolatopsis decaplanina]|uniref:Integrase family protein n=1 Tax=Amycolatopsis decaplanina DSM 44594 TaxID=1284240 RepID=M2YU54_9PSEU|nr:site-specific integrase [Amycolatopsis decaplanina]EME52258.1 integrase family protein [Amycolatopsis decaplanina DSM 44594]